MGLPETAQVPKFLAVAAVAERLRVSRATIHAWVASGKLHQRQDVPVAGYLHNQWTPLQVYLSDAAGQSGLSLAAFARRHGLCDRQLYWWRARFRAYPDIEPATRPFVRIRTQALPSLESSGVEILVSDVTIRLAPGFCAETLAQAVAALRTPPC